MTDIELHDGQPAMPDKSPEARRWNDLYALAKLVADTDMAPRNLRGRPAAVFAVFAFADEVGIKPMAALREVNFIEGVPRPSAIMQRALILRAGHSLQWRALTDTEATLWGRRRDDGRELTITWTEAKARQAKLWGKANWATYPSDMLAARATSQLARLLFADVVLGMEYTPEEVGAVGPIAAIDVGYSAGDDGVELVEDPDVSQDDDDGEEIYDPVTEADVADAWTAQQRYEARRRAEEDEADAEWTAAARGEGDADDQEPDG